MKVLDMLGNEITRGSIITYPGRMGAAMWMNFAVVKSVGSFSGTYQTPQLTLDVVRVDMKRKTKRETTVFRLDRILVVPPSQLDLSNVEHLFLNEVVCSLESKGGEQCF
jgi:hypothetical protein